MAEKNLENEQEILHFALGANTLGAKSDEATHSSRAPLMKMSPLPPHQLDFLTSNFLEMSIHNSTHKRRKKNKSQGPLPETFFRASLKLKANFGRIQTLRNVYLPQICPQMSPQSEEAICQSLRTIWTICREWCTLAWKSAASANRNDGARQIVRAHDTFVS